jgi:hypothetical protein
MRVLRTSSSEAADSGTRDMASYYDHLVVADRTMPIKAIDDGPYRGTGGLVVNTELARKMPIWPDDSDGQATSFYARLFSTARSCHKVNVPTPALMMRQFRPAYQLPFGVPDR